LFDKGEERLLHSVRKGEIPIHTAAVIAEFQGQPMQEAIMRIQSEQKLSANSLKRLRNLITARKAFGPKSSGSRTSRTGLTADSIVRAVKREQERQRETLKKAQLCEKRLVFVVNAMKKLFSDDYFITILRAEGLSDLPRFLADSINGEA
jgi:ParB family chromosome partitioning protein